MCFVVQTPSSVGRASVLQTGCRRFEPGGVYSIHSRIAFRPLLLAKRSTAIRKEHCEAFTKQKVPLYLLLLPGILHNTHRTKIHASQNECFAISNVFLCLYAVLEIFYGSCISSFYSRAVGWFGFSCFSHGFPICLY